MDAKIKISISYDIDGVCCSGDKMGRLTKLFLYCYHALEDYKHAALLIESIEFVVTNKYKSVLLRIMSRENILLPDEVLDAVVYEFTDISDDETGVRRLIQKSIHERLGSRVIDLQRITNELSSTFLAEEEKFREEESVARGL